MICRTAVELVCRSVDVPLSATERAGLCIHTFFCGPCRRFYRQLLRLHEACEAAVTDDVAVAVNLSAEARERIVATLKQAPSGS